MLGFFRFYAHISFLSSIATNSKKPSKSVFGIAINDGEGINDALYAVSLSKLIQTA